MSFDLAMAAGFEAMKNRQSLFPLLVATLKTSVDPGGADRLCGLLESICCVLDSCQKQGVGFQWKNATARQIAEAQPHARRLLLATHCRTVDQPMADLLSALTNAVDAVGVQINEAQAKAAEPPPVQLVRIVGEPQRITETQVTRDDAGNITAAANITRDA